MNNLDARRGGLAALAAYVLWGFFPLYFKTLAHIPAGELLAHRILWGALLTGLLVMAQGKSHVLLAAIANRKRLLLLCATSILIAINWGCFVWAVVNGRALDASLGYFIYPLFSVLLGAAALRERLRPAQWAAVGLVGLGVAILTSGLGRFPWLVMTFPVSFSLYGLLRKQIPVDAVVGLTIEAMLLSPLALIYLALQPEGGAFLHAGWTDQVLLVAAGPITATPLVLFGYGARRLNLSTLGLMQYVNPTLQMVIALGFLGETLSRTQIITFVFIWAGLLLYWVPAIKWRTG